MKSISVPIELLEDMLNPCADFATHERLRALLDNPTDQHQGDPVAGHCTHPPGCKFCSWCGFKAEQPATVADHPQCEECKGWGYHENHHEGGGTECGECGGSGKAAVSVVMPEPYSLAMFQMISGFESVTPEQFDLVWSACREEVSRLNGIKP